MNAIVRMMTVRKPISAALVGVAVLVFVVFALGFGNSPTFGDPFSGLSTTLQTEFTAGQQNFASVDTVAGGLGPVYNNVSCVSCHSTPAAGGGSTTLETRYGTVTGGVFNPLAQYGGSLIHSQGIGLFNGVDFVGEIVPQSPAVPGGPATIVAGRRTTPLFGLGLVGAVPNSTFQTHCQSRAAIHAPDRGPCQHRQRRLRRRGSPPAVRGPVWVEVSARHAVRFRRRRVLERDGDHHAFIPERKLSPGSDSRLPCELRLLEANPASSNPNEPDNDDLTQFTEFITLLAPPPQLPLTSRAKLGAVTFAQIGCANCHLPALTTGSNSIPELNEVTFFPFSDFLLHDMGSLGDGIAQSGAGQTEMRTAPLWGVRVITSFLHDGRASTLSAAILAHAGQGQAARNNFANLSATAQANLIAFLNSL